jgi:hypothetical protein
MATDDATLQSLNYLDDPARYAVIRGVPIFRAHTRNLSADHTGTAVNLVGGLLDQGTSTAPYVKNALPRVLPATVRLRVRVSTAISSGTNIFIDRLAMGTISALYTGGPGAAIFSGNVPFIQGDGWNVTTTNDRGGSSNMGTFQALFDRLFNMRALGLLLPSSGLPTIADTLISA